MSVGISITLLLALLLCLGARCDGGPPTVYIPPGGCLGIDGQPVDGARRVLEIRVKHPTRDEWATIVRDVEPGCIAIPLVSRAVVEAGEVELRLRCVWSMSDWQVEGPWVGPDLSVRMSAGECP